MEFLITPGSTADVTALKHFNFDLSSGSKLYADGAYNDQQFEELLREASGIALVPKRKKNSKRINSSKDEFILRYYRGRIETTFIGIVKLMPRSIQAKTPKGFLLKVLFFVLGYVINRLFKTS